MTANRRPRVIIVGAGFGGLYAARTLENKPVEVLLIDRHNFHTFTPLLYQVATCGLEPEEIAYPVRGIFRGRSNVRFLMGEVTALDADAHSIDIRTNGHTRHETYDFLIVAGGSVTTYFGRDAFAEHAFILKELGDAVTLRNHILRLFERAEWTDDPVLREAYTTLVVVGGGPTGLEMAGALQELYANVLRKEYGALDGLRPHVILVEAADRLLTPFPPSLQRAALEQASALGIEVLLGNPVEDVAADHVRLRDGRVIPTHTLVWSAGVQAGPLAGMLNVPVAKGGRVPIKATTEVIGRDSIYVVGDMAYLENPDGQPYPMLIPVAKQQGILAARNILRRVAGEAEQPFHYQDRGIMATIGRSRAVASIFNRIQLRGFVAWLAWLGLHLIALMGFRNRLNVFVNWVVNYVTYDRAVRIILDRNVVLPESEPAGEPEPELP